MSLDFTNWNTPFISWNSQIGQAEVKLYVTVVLVWFSETV